MLKSRVRESVVQAVKVNSFSDVVEKGAYVLAAVFALAVVWLVFNLMGWGGMIALFSVFMILTLLKLMFIWLM